MPMEEMRDAKVDGFMPSNSAAPRGPETLPLVCFRAFIIVSRSCRFNSFAREERGLPRLVWVAPQYSGVPARRVGRRLADHPATG